MFRRFLRRADPVERIAPEEGLDGYRIYTRKYDEVISAQDLLKRDPFAHLAHQAAQEFRATMAAKISALTTGAILAAGVARQDPAFRDNGLITLLIDLSGSMRGMNAQLAALTAEAVAAFAEAHDCRLEILGFTTADWHGKPVRGDWIRQGRPANPGRLCALRHVVLSEFGGRTWQRLDLLFAGGFFRENVDGEAIEWALERLRAASGTHRLLIYASDGAPVDDSTLSCNPPEILWNHLTSVLATVQHAGDVRLAAIGLKHAVEHLVPGGISVQSFHEIEDRVIPYLTAELGAALGELDQSA